MHPSLPPVPSIAPVPPGAAGPATAPPQSLVPPNSVGIFRGQHVQAACLFSVLARIQNMKGSKQVFRSRVLNALHVQLREFEEARLGLIQQYGKKDEKGQLVQKQVAPGMESYDLADKEGYNAAYERLKKEVPIIVDGSKDVLLGKALGIVYDILHSDDCPPLASPRPGQAMHECEAMVFAQVIDGFEFQSLTAPPR